MYRSDFSIPKLFSLHVVFRAARNRLLKWARLENEPNKPQSKPEVLRRKFTDSCHFIRSRMGADEFGDYLEFGVFRGASLTSMFQTLVELKLDRVRLFGFDSFAGFPFVAAIDNENEIQPGDYACHIELTSQCLMQNGVDFGRTFLIEGWFKDTLTPARINSFNIKKASLILIDCDLHSSAKDALTFCAPLICDTSIVFLCNWDKERSRGERRAFEEFLCENPTFKAEPIDNFKLGRFTIGQIFSITNARHTSP